MGLKEGKAHCHPSYNERRVVTWMVISGQKGMLLLRISAGDGILKKRGYFHAIERSSFDAVTFATDPAYSILWPIQVSNGATT